MTVFLPTSSALLDVARLLELEPNDPAVAAAFDALVLRGNLKPWLPGWWELHRLHDQPVLDAAAQLGLVKG